jgi:hypothetical protein
MSDKANRELHRKAALGDERAQQALKRTQQRTCKHRWIIRSARERWGYTEIVMLCWVCEAQKNSTLEEQQALCEKKGHDWEWQDSYFYHATNTITDVFRCPHCWKEAERAN